MCSACGTVVAESVLREPAGPPSDRETGGDARIRPQLIYSGRDIEGRPVPADMLWKTRQTAQKFNLGSQERAAVVFENRLRRLGSQRQVPETVIRRAIEVYYKVREADTFKKPNLEDLALALIMVACRESRHVTTYEDLIDDPERSSTKVRNLLVVILRDVVRTRNAGGAIDEMRFTVGDFLKYYAEKLERFGLSKAMVENALFFAQVKYKNYGSKDFFETLPGPHVIAAAFLFNEMKDAGATLSQREFCSIVNLSEISLREKISALGPYYREKFAPSRTRPDDLDG